MPAYAVRLRAPATELLRVMEAWSTKCDKILMYEHSERETNIHCHLLLTGVYVSTESLKQDYRKIGLVLKGPGQVSFKQTFKAGVSGLTIDITETTWLRYITYMTKGIHDAAYNKGFEQEYLDECKAAWRHQQVDTPEDKHMQAYCELIDEHVKSVQKLTLDYDRDAIPVYRLRTIAIDYAMRAYKGHLNMQAKRLAIQLYQTFAYSEGKIESSEIILPGEPWKPPSRKPKV